jgi:hypothetical protein
MTYSKDEKAMWIEDWQKSGKKAWTYAKENGLIPQTFAAWTKRLKEKPTGFVEIKSKINPRLEQSEILIEKEDLRIHLPVGMNSRDIILVIESLRVAV